VTDGLVILILMTLETNKFQKYEKQTITKFVMACNAGDNDYS